VRQHVWVLLSILLLAAGTVIALTRQQVNFDDHKRIANEACQLALRNRLLVLKLTDIEAAEPEHVAQAAALDDLRSEVRRLIASADCSR
jgi:hypothetical protein